jgi:hypothetical protein
MIAEGTVLDIDQDLRQKLGISPGSSILNFVKVRHQVAPVVDQHTIERIEGPERKRGLSNAGRKRKARPGIKRTFEMMQKRGQCKNCKEYATILHDEQHADLVCTNCGEVQERTFGGIHGDGETDFGDRETQVVKRRTSHATCYEESNHFRDIFMQAQGLENLKVPDGLLELMKEYMQVNRIEQTTLKPSDTYRILRDIKRPNLYKHRVKLTYFLSGVPPFTLNQDQTKLVCQDFEEIREPWRLVKNTTLRKNLLSYSFLLFKICERHGFFELCEVCYLLKTNSKLHALDEIWKTFCEILGWTFIPSPTFNSHYK